MKIRLENVNKRFGTLCVLKNISFNVLEGEFISIIGPSGCGKTTLLHLIQGFSEQSSGSIETYGEKGFVFQDHSLFPWKTVKENIEVGPINKGKNKDVIRKITKSLIKEINLKGFENHYPNQISEGMKQRVGIARALANNPEILLMDEPFGSLDYFTRLKMQDFILKVKKERKLTILFVTHDIDEAIKLSERIIVLSRLPSRVIEIIKVNQDHSNLKKRILDLTKFFKEKNIPNL